MADLAALAAALQPLPVVDPFKSKLADANTPKARAEWSKTSRQIRRNTAFQGTKLVKLEATELQRPHIGAAYDHCWNIGAADNEHWETQRFPIRTNVGVKTEADKYLFSVIVDTFKDEQTLGRLNAIEDSAPNPGIAAYHWLDVTFGSVDIEDTMPMLLSIVEKELIANQSVPKFVAAFGLQQQEIVAAYTTRANNGTITVDRERLLDHLFGVLAYARLPEGIRSSLKTQLLAWTSAQFSMKAVLAAAVKENKLESAMPADSDNREVAALVAMVDELKKEVEQERNACLGNESQTELAALTANRFAQRNAKAGSSRPAFCNNCNTEGHMRKDCKQNCGPRLSEPTLPCSCLLLIRVKPNKPIPSVVHGLHGEGKRGDRVLSPSLSPT